MTASDSSNDKNKTTEQPKTKPRVKASDVQKPEQQPKPKPVSEQKVVETQSTAKDTAKPSAPTDGPRPSTDNKFSASKAASASTNQTNTTDNTKTSKTTTKSTAKAATKDNPTNKSSGAKNHDADKKPPRSPKAGNSNNNGGSGGGLAKVLSLIALLLAIIAAIAVVYMWWQNQQQNELYSTAVEENGRLLAEQNALKEKLQNEISTASSSLVKLQQSDANFRQQFSDLKQRTGNVEQQLQRNLDIVDDQREVLAMAEVISRINFGVRAAKLSNNPNQAAEALGSARELLFRIDANKYAKELTDLQTVIDNLNSYQLANKTTQWVGHLNSLITSSNLLTVLQPDTASPNQPEANAGTRTVKEQPWYAVPDQVDLRPFFYFENEEISRLSNILPTEAAALKQNLSMHFSVASLHLAQGNTAAMNGTLSAASTFMETWFVQNERYASMQTLIGKLAEAQPAPDLTADLLPINTLVDSLRERSREQASPQVR